MNLTNPDLNLNLAHGYKPALDKRAKSFVSIHKVFLEAIMLEPLKDLVSHQ